MFKGIVLHWTAGNYTPNSTDLEHYHYFWLQQKDYSMNNY